MIPKSKIKARFIMRIAGIPRGLSVPDYVNRYTDAITDVTAEVLEEIQLEEKVMPEEKNETQEIIETAIFLLIALLTFILLMAGQVYYALTFSVLSIIFLLIYKIAMAFYFKRPSQ